MYSCNSRMRRPTGLMGLYLPLDSTTAKQIPSPGLKTSLSVRTPPPSLRLARSRVHMAFKKKKKKKNRLESVLGETVWGILQLTLAWELQKMCSGCAALH